MSELLPGQCTKPPPLPDCKTTMSNQTSVTTELEQAIANSTITDEDIATYQRDG